LTTIGFGDYHPKSDVERIFIAFNLLVGIGVFSSFIGEFFEMLDKINTLTEYYEDSSNLSRFFGVL